MGPDTAPKRSSALGGPKSQRLGYIDWLRGLACLGMFEVHAYDAWLGGAARKGSVFYWSRFSGTLPAPLFVFLSGVACALVTDRMRRKGIPDSKIAARMIRRGFQIFALGLVFRAQEFVLAWPAAPWTDLARVDVLNMIGLSIVAMGAVCWIARTRTTNAILAAALALAVAMVTPPLWTTWSPNFLPWYLESYVNGVHNLGTPQAWLFPMFPWSAFAFAGLAVGLVLFADWPAKNPAKAVTILGAGGVALFYAARALDGNSVRLYASYDYWHTSPNFFLARLAILLMLMLAGFAYCQWGPGRLKFSPLMQMGQTSLLVYWVHIEFVYGKFSILPKRAESVPMATLGLAIIFVAMLLLSIARTRTKGRGAEAWAWIRRRVGQLFGAEDAVTEG
ncbi:MAG: heparan-alpha-glucosaminide N-acetyltransferase domain-containing protein [Candidatus Acidiferrales bacterium]